MKQILLTSLLLTCSTATWALEYRSLMISSRQGGDVLLGQIRAGVMAIGSGGRLIVIDSNGGQGTEIKDLIRKMPSEERNRIILLKGFDKKWLRDDASFWSQDGSQVPKLMSSSKDRNLSFGSTAMAAFLNLCSGGTVSLPEIVREPLGQGGNIVSDEAKTCAISEDLLNPKTRAVYKDRLKCEKIIEVPGKFAGNWPQHRNGHADIGIGFLAPKVAIVPTIPESCADPASNTYRLLFDKIASRAIEKGVHVERLNTALDCVPPEGFNGDFTREEVRPTQIERGTLISQSKFSEVVLRTYSNLQVMNESYLVPQYLPPSGYYLDNEKKKYVEIPPSPNLVKQYQDRNTDAINRIKSLITAGTIPEKKIVQMPIAHWEVSSGGATRCLTLPIPDSLDKCTQENVDLMMKAYADTLEMYSECLPSTQSPEICASARNTFQALNFLSLSSAKWVVLQDVDKEGPEERNNTASFKNLNDALEKLKSAILRFCGGLIPLVKY